MVSRFVTGVVLSGAVSSVLAAESFAVPAQLWDHPRSGRTLLEAPAVRQAVAMCLAQPGARLVIHYAPGQESLLQAEELRAWLVALAVDTSRIRLNNNAKPAESPIIEVVP